MGKERPITPQQALLAVKAAGLDPEKLLSEQLSGPAQLDEGTVRGWVSEAIGEAMGAADQASASQSTDRSRRSVGSPRATGTRSNQSLTPWMGESTTMQRRAKQSAQAELDRLRQQAAAERVKARDL
jgi:hypothetical protein